MHLTKLNALADIISEKAEFDRDITWESVSEVSGSSKNDEHIHLSVSFEFNDEDHPDSEDTESQDAYIWYDFATKEVTIEHPYCTNLDELKVAAKEFFDANVE